MRVFGRIQLIPYIKSTYQISIYVKMKVDLSYLSRCRQFFLQILENKNLSQILARQILKSQVFTRWFLMQLNARLLQAFKQRELPPDGGPTIQALSDQINFVPRVLSLASKITLVAAGHVVPKMWEPTMIYLMGGVVTEYNIVAVVRKDTKYTGELASQTGCL